MKKFVSIMAMCLLLVTVLTACSLSGTMVSDDDNTPKLKDEGVDTKCEITGYSTLSGVSDSYFLKEGDKIAVISPSALPSKSQVDAVMEGLEDWGFEPVQGQYVYQETRTLDQQLEDFLWALEDPEIKAVFCVRGGYGATDVMDRVSLDKLKEADKPIIGYSDISVYHSAWTRAGLISVHSCMSGTFTGLPEDCLEAEKQMILGNIPSYKCTTDEKCVPGEASGIIIGGNLSTYTAVLGTAYDSSKIGQPYILFVEDVGEDLQHIHRYLTVLKHMGILDNAQAIIFGEWTELPYVDDGDYAAARGGAFESTADMIRRQFLDDLDIPIAFGFPAGHGDFNYPLLMGSEVHLSISENSYTLEW